MKKLIMGLMAISAVMVYAQSRNAIQTRYIRERVRIISQDATSISGKVITVYCQGKKKTWATTNDIVIINKPVKGYRRFSKMKAVAVLTEMGMWDEVKKWIVDNGMYDLYLAAQFFSEDNEHFLRGMEVMKTKFGMSDAQAEEFLKKIEDK